MQERDIDTGQTAAAVMLTAISYYAIIFVLHVLLGVAIWALVRAPSRLLDWKSDVTGIVLAAFLVWFWIGAIG